MNAALTVGAQVEFKGNVWTVQAIDFGDGAPLAKAYNESIGVAGFAVLARDSKRRHYEAVARILTNGTVDKFI